MDAATAEQPDSDDSRDDFREEPITVVLPRISTRDLVKEYQAEWAAKGLVGQGGAK